MKKLLKNLFFFGAVGSVAILASCGGDDETVLPAQPSIEVDVTGLEDTSTPYEAMPGETVTFTVNMDVPGVFNVLRVVGTDGDTEVYSQEFPRGNAAVTANPDNTEATVVINIDFTAENVGQEVEFEFEVVDNSDQTATTTVTVTVVAPPSPEARDYGVILLAAPLDTKNSETFFSTNTGETYTMNEVNNTTDPVSANIDFGYFYGSGAAGTAATLASPAAYPFAYGQAAWGTRNETIFRRTSLGETAFGAEGTISTWADIDEAFEAADDADADPGIESGLEVGQVLAFETAATKTGGAKRGLILVKDITPGDGADGKIELVILVQEEVED